MWTLGSVVSLYRFVSKDRFYINDVLSPNNSRFGDFVDHVYPIELEIKEDIAKFCLIQKSTDFPGKQAKKPKILGPLYIHQKEMSNWMS
jgi:hypothetical protein